MMNANQVLSIPLAGLGLCIYTTEVAAWSAFDASALQNGQNAVIPNWDLAPSPVTSSNTSGLSLAGNGDWNLWHQVPVSRCTIIGCLHASGVSPWDNLETVFWSDNLIRYSEEANVNHEWLYRREFILSPARHRHFFLETHGITSSADILLNGKQIASRETQAGAYGGRNYDITSIASDVNALLITVYPTNYDFDFAQGFMDWNPYPPDNGTGIWRNITLRQTGPVLLTPMQIQTEFRRVSSVQFDWDAANVTIRTTARNLENQTVMVLVSAELFDPTVARLLFKMGRQVDLPPYSSTEITFKQSIEHPPIWWPRQWGKPRLVRAQINATVDGVLSDYRHNTVGLREVTSELNKHGDLVFSLNQHPLQVLGAGYAPDLFLRWDSDRFEKMCEYALDMGLNTLRLEGKMEQPELYDIADRLGVLVLPGWECCGKWEAWDYNDELAVSPVPTWTQGNLATAGANMAHEASALQAHPSVLGFMVGSDFHPDDAATAVYVDALQRAGWDAPIVSSGSRRGYPAQLGPSGMKMDGPYDWVPPNYWWDTKSGSSDHHHHKGAAFGFGSELGTGVGTPEMGSLVKFLSPEEIDQLWQSPNASSSCHNGRVDNNNPNPLSSRKIYNDALGARYGAPTSAADYLQKAQMMDYEATRAQFEAYAAMWTTRRRRRPATGMVYWMLNNAWPSLHWNLFDYYLRPGGSYFGAKAAVAAHHQSEQQQQQHVAYDYHRKQVAYWIDDYAGEKRTGYYDPQSHPEKPPQTVHVEAVDTHGVEMLNKTIKVVWAPNTSKVLVKKHHLRHALNKNSQRVRRGGVAFLRLRLYDETAHLVRRNVYWLTTRVTDKIAWGKKEEDDDDGESNEWYYTPVRKYADYTALNHLPRANVSVTARQAGEDPQTASESIPDDPPPLNTVNITLTNNSPVPAVFIRLNLVNKRGAGENKTSSRRWEDVVPVKWDENYVTLWPHETMVLLARLLTDVKAAYLQVDGKNVDTPEIVEIVDSE